jgi:hypothetical protein
MKKLLSLVTITTLMLALSGTNSFAVGFGVFVDASNGSGEAEWESDYDSWDIDSKTVAGGFVLDTSPTNESKFNYRLNVGYASQKIDDENNETLDSNGLYVENIFGFSLVKKENFRLWLGPLVRIGFYSGETDTIEYGGVTEKTEIDYAELGVGAVLGLNFKAGNAVLSPSIGFRYCGFAGEGESTYEDAWIKETYIEDIEGYTTTAFANLAVLF